ncbi:MAG TPA: antitoxin [Candidatus Limnocylindria bacterium]|nr:antitoxin [Candidatus Limnocylindria bacterium]
MPRTTIDIDPAVLAELKRRTRHSGQSLGQLASDLLAAALNERPPDRTKLSWRSAPMRARVDLPDKEALRRALDEQ